MQSRFDKELSLRLYGSEERVLLGVSGGIDSMVMANLFKNSSTKVKFAIAHCNFGLRPGDCDLDQEFVRCWAEVNNIPFHTVKFDTKEYVKQSGTSTQVACRELRYRWFEKISADHGYSRVSIAHNVNDNVETLFINLLRGAGLKGICGIPISTSKIIRPMMIFSRAEILKYAQDNGIQYREDSSNRDSYYTRNKIRNLLFPILEEVNPSFLNVINREIDYFRQANSILDDLFEKRRSELCTLVDGVEYIDIERLQEEKHASYWLYRLMERYGFNSSQIEQCYQALESQSGKEFVSDRYRAIRDRRYIKLYPIGDCDVDDTERVKVEVVINSDDLDLRVGAPNTLYVNADIIAQEITIRHWRASDRFKPLGMRGFKKVSDFLTDAKLDIEQKRHQLVVTTIDTFGNEQIICLVGQRVDDRYKVQHHTRLVLKIQNGF